MSMMSTLMTVMRKELRDLSRDRRTLLLTLLFGPLLYPVLLLGMGKLGAVELNLSSDIDLIFAFPEGGETEGVKRSLDNQEFFTRLGQRIIHLLTTQTASGQLYDVDMRLRPSGASGLLVLSLIHI